jgi:hypothetical protein
MLEKIRASIDGLDWIILLLLVIFADGIVGGLYRAGGKETTSKVIGWIMIAACVCSWVSFLHLGGILGVIARVVTIVCFILDLVSVIRDKRIRYLAD